MNLDRYTLGYDPTTGARIKLLAQAMLCVACVVFLRLAWVHLFGGKEVEDAADKVGRARISAEPVRGTIFDLRGRPMTAELSDYCALVVQRSRLLDPSRLARDLSRVLGRPVEHYKKRLERGEWITVARQVPRDKGQKLLDMGWNLYLQPDTKRIYPNGALASQVLGLTDIDRRGVSGVEEQFQSELAGTPGWRVVKVDRTGRIHLKDNLPYEPAVDGANVHLTIELELQSILEEELNNVLLKSKAEYAAGIILVPNTGEIRAMASLPNFDGNSREGPEENRKCRVITDQIEPGSTMKIVAAAGLLDYDRLEEQDSVNTSPGFIVVHKHRIHDVKDCGYVTLSTAVSKSSNVGMIKFSDALSDEEIYRLINKFGFLGRTGVELTGEVSGNMPPMSQWSGTTRPNLIIGHGLSVTMLQMANAYAAVANGGVMMVPTIVRGIESADGRFKEHEPTKLRRVISKRSAAQLTEMLTEVVETGTGRAARVEGLKVAGKTGTGQKPNLVSGGYYKDRYYASFVGFLPAEAPEYLIMIGIDDPRGAHQGGEIAAPVFGKIARRILGLKSDLRKRAAQEAQRDLVELRQKAERDETPAKVTRTQGEVKVPDLSLMSLRNARLALEKASLGVKAHGRGKVVWEQSPLPGETVQAGSVVHLALGPISTERGKIIVVPTLTDLSLRDAIRRASGLGLDLRVQGTGKVVKQSPSAGAQLKPGAVLWLTANG